jgi:hypothetical protein
LFLRVDNSSKVSSVGQDVNSQRGERKGGQRRMSCINNKKERTKNPASSQNHPQPLIPEKKGETTTGDQKKQN